MTEIPITAQIHAGQEPELTATGSKTLSPLAETMPAEKDSSQGLSSNAVQPLEDPRHESHIQSLARQVQSGQYHVQPQEVAAAWLKTIR